MAKYKVRDGFAVKIGKDVFRPGDVVDLTAEQAEEFCLRIEEVAQAKAAPKVEAEPKAKAKAEK